MPGGNDLSEYLDDQVRARIKKVAAKTMDTLDSQGWEAIFGPAEEPSKEQKAAAVITASRSVETPARPWRR